MKRIHIGHRAPTTLTVNAQNMPHEAFMAELTRAIDSRTDLPKEEITIQPSGIVPQIVDSVMTPIYNAVESVDIPMRDNEPVTDSKESLDNSDITELLGFDIDMSAFEEKIKNVIDGKIEVALSSISTNGSNSECKTISDLVIRERETARFTITTEQKLPVIGFMYELITPINLVCTSHIEKINDNIISVVVNNLNNKIVTFGIEYVAFF